MLFPINTKAPKVAMPSTAFLVYFGLKYLTNIGDINTPMINPGIIYNPEIICP
jgi:hypothetical protein